ncbi:alpha/beta hydrolase [Alcaligenaceae bacterium]|nr:alpha/beta hydrolase [Alcaligenaceae bacterium]
MKTSNTLSSSHVHYFQNRKGMTLAADVGGEPSGQPILLLHGGGQTRHSWRRTLDVLVQQGYYVISLDARGHGDSQWAPDSNYAMEELGNDLLDVVATLARKPVVIGASMGGLAGLLAIGLADPDVFHSLILVDIVPGLDPDGSQKVLDFLEARLDGFDNLEQVAEAVSAYNPNRPKPKDSSGLMKNLRYGDNGRLYWHWDPVFFAGSDAIHTPDFREHLYAICASISFPVLLIRGMSSDIVTDHSITELKKHVPHLQVFGVSKAGHMITGDQNDIFNEGILAFITQDALVD